MMKNIPLDNLIFFFLFKSLFVSSSYNHPASLYFNYPLNSFSRGNEIRLLGFYKDEKRKITPVIILPGDSCKIRHRLPSGVSMATNMARLERNLEKEKARVEFGDRCHPIIYKAMLK